MSDKQDRKKQARDYVRYSGMAMEMFGLLLVLVLVGRYIDRWMGNEKNYVTAALTIIGLFGYLYKLYIQLIKPGKK